MSLRSTSLIAATLFPVLLFCQPPRQEINIIECRALSDAMRAWGAAIKAGNINKIMTFYTPDAGLLPAGSHICQGLPMVREFWTNLLADPVVARSISVQLGSVQAAMSGELGWTLATISYNSAGPNGKQEHNFFWITIHSKIDRKWLVYSSVSYDRGVE
jgi:ketosteroid isomerase-like protein